MIAYFIEQKVFDALNFKRGSNNSKFLQKKWEAMGPGRMRVRNRKRKTREPSGEENVKQRSSRKRLSMASSSKEIDSEDGSENSYTYDESSYDSESGSAMPMDPSSTIGSESGSLIQMPPLPATTYRISNAFDIPVHLITSTEGRAPSAASRSNLELKSAAENKAPKTTRIKNRAAKVKAPTKVSTTSGGTENPDPPSSKSSSAVVVDPSVFVEEIHAGRYPSIKVYTGEHMIHCLICKEDNGQLLNCEFCSNSEHVECLKTRVNIRGFEPDDEFMCHKCIQTILARRARAQKRRLQKRDERLGTQNEDKPMEPSLVTPHESYEIPSESTRLLTTDSALILAATPNAPCVDNVSPTSTFNCPNGGPGGLICCEVCTASYSKMLSHTENEQEINMVSKIGQEVSELMELLTDAQIRLQQALDASKGNDKRRKLLSSSSIME